MRGVIDEPAGRFPPRAGRALIRAQEVPPMLETSPAPAATAPAFAMPLEEAMRTQRAIRRLKPDPVDDALVLRLIELALKAPTGSNAQNWEFVMVKDRAVKERLGALNRGAFRIYGGLGRWLARSEPPMLRIIEAVQWQGGHLPHNPRGAGPPPR